MKPSHVSVLQSNNNLQVLTLTGTQRRFNCKRDIKQLLFDKEQLMMFKKIRDARSLLDTHSRIKDRLPPDSVRKLKHQQLDEDRKIDIEKENRRLLQSIAHIVNKRKGLRERRDSNSSINSRKSSVKGSPAKSLNYGYKAMVETRIQKENTRMLDRLQLQKGCIDALEFKRHSKKHDKLLSSISS